MDRSPLSFVPGHPAGGGGRDDGGVGKRPGPGHAAGLVAVDPGVVLLDLGLRGEAAT